MRKESKNFYECRYKNLWQFFHLHGAEYFIRRQLLNSATFIVVKFMNRKFLLCFVSYCDFIHFKWDFELINRFYEWCHRCCFTRNKIVFACENNGNKHDSLSQVIFLIRYDIFKGRFERDEGRKCWVKKKIFSIASYEGRKSIKKLIRCYSAN